MYLSADAIASLHECLKRRPATVPGDYVFWNQKRPTRVLSVKAIQKKMARYAKATGMTASCHRLRHTFASNLLEQGAEIVSIRELLGHARANPVSGMRRSRTSMSNRSTSRP
jgi:site-specific recombinase XerD